MKRHKNFSQMMMNPPPPDDLKAVVERLNTMLLSLSPLVKTQRIERGSFDSAIQKPFIVY